VSFLRAKNAKKILVVADLHNTLIDSTSAFAKAFLKLNSKLSMPDIEKRLLLKESRHKLAKEYKISYSKLLEEYSKQERINKKLVRLLKIFKSIGMPIVVITSSKGKRANLDRKYLEKYIKPDTFISNAVGKKGKARFWNNLVSSYHADFCLYIGNDTEEDAISGKKMISLLNSEYVAKKFYRLCKGQSIKNAR